MLEVLIILVFYFLSSMMIIGYGQFGKMLFFNNKANFKEIGVIGLFGFLILYNISTVINFFSNINEFIIIIVFLIGLIFFIIFIIHKNFNIKTLIIFYLTLLLFSLLGIISENNEDFYFYYQPYMNYLSASKIIFGVVNINNTLAFSTNSLYDIIILFNVNDLIQSSSSAPILIFYVLYLSYLIEKVFERFNIFYFVVLFLSIVSFTKLRDFGTMLPPQLLLILIFCLTYSIFIDDKKNDTYAKILILFTLAIILRFNSVIIGPLFILILFTKYKIILKFVMNNKKLFLFTVFTFIFFITKNIINSGCLVYPVSTLCIKELTWSSNLKVTEQKYNKLKSDSKGWPFYAKESFNIKNKFVWENLERENFYNYNNYFSTSPLFWGKYWLMDPNYKKIINLFLLSLFIVLILSIKKNGKIDSEQISKKHNFLLLISILLITILWFFLSPQMRYGGYFCFIILFSLIISFLSQKFFKKVNYLNLFILIFIAVGYLNLKNLNRIYDDVNNQKFENFPWPNNYELFQNLDFVKFTLDNTNYNRRLKTDKLIFNNGEEAILMCGKIDFPCIPDGKEICLGKRYNFYSYNLYKKNKNESNCYNFMNKNILY